MISHPFSLIPFPASARLPHISISGSISRRASVLSVSYKLAGSMAELAIPQRAAVPQRRDSLWGNTCFEFFIGTACSERYREFNLSPSGYWNAFRFDSYRTGMQEEHAVELPELHIDSGADALVLSAVFDLSRIIGMEQALEVGISSVIERAGGEMSYWALNHPGPRPDFHLREAFLLRL